MQTPLSKDVSHNSRDDCTLQISITLPNIQCQVVSKGTLTDDHLETQIAAITNALQKMAKAIIPSSPLNTNSTILDLPPDVLNIILGYLNQRDKINLSKTHSKFGGICKASLFNSIYVYNEFDRWGTISIPKTYYTPFYMNHTIIRQSNFFLMITGGYYRSDLIKEIIFVDDTFVTNRGLSLIANQSNCPIRFINFEREETRDWFMENQKRSNSEYYRLGSNTQSEDIQPFKNCIRYLTIEKATSSSIQINLPHFQNLKRINVVNPPSFTITSPVLCSELHLDIFNQTLLGDVLSWFDLSAVKILKIATNQDTYYEGIQPRCEKFRSLVALQIPFHPIEQWTRIIRSLRRDSLKEIYLDVWANRWERTTFDNAMSGLTHHQNSLRILSSSRMEHAFRGSLLIEDLPRLNVCRRKLFKSVYVYDDNDPKTKINIPKKFYSPFYMKHTIIGSNRFYDFISSVHYDPDLIKRILFVHDSFISVKTLDCVAKQAPRCAIRFQDISFDDTKSWLKSHEQNTIDDYHLFGNELEESYPLERLSTTTHLIILQADPGWIERYLPKYANLKSVKIIDPPSFVLQNPMNVPELYLKFSNRTLVRDLLKCFNVSRIRQLYICSRDQETYFDTIFSMAGDFNSLRALKVDGTTIEQLWKFVANLRCDSLNEMFYTLSDPTQTIEFTDEIVEALSHHKNSLKIISLSPIEKEVFRVGKLPESTFAEFDLLSFVSLENFVVDKQVLVVDRVPRKPRLVPLEFYSKQEF
ncbi:uncharacterized protein J8A68_004527 [[Candida] subhashii]|uniref:F-box domain-containing protein n=1 Tax=[Candida] subhashii TaxID=561895 RepID=A0A8J5UWV3_9ASCO|nr:uncharacterized protein J8A68_004527 [[Candida] subhashii]KAG7661924.1 hypothetical protein J8A68_004527 [[Candida] subhashii]